MSQPRAPGRACRAVPGGTHRAWLGLQVTEVQKALKDFNYPGSSEDLARHGGDAGLVDALRRLDKPDGFDGPSAVIHELSAQADALDGPTPAGVRSGGPKTSRVLPGNYTADSSCAHWSPPTPQGKRTCTSVERALHRLTTATPPYSCGPRRQRPRAALGVSGGHPVKDEGERLDAEPARYEPPARGVALWWPVSGTGVVRRPSGPEHDQLSEMPLSANCP